MAIQLPVKFLNNFKGLSAEDYIQCKYLEAGELAEKQSYKSPFDLLINHRFRLEVKVAHPTIKKIISKAGKTYQYLSWFVNIHRHNILKHQCDAYLIIALDTPKGHLYKYFLPREITVKTLDFRKFGLDFKKLKNFRPKMITRQPWFRMQKLRRPW